jgi:hypothetical protein
MKYSYSILILLFCLSLSGCKKDNELDISGITTRDELAQPYGSVDTTDWRMDDVWNKEIESYFSVKSGIYNKSAVINIYGGVAPGLPESPKFYPNPFVSGFLFHTPFSSKCSIRIVDKNKHVVFAVDLDNPNNQMISGEFPETDKTVYYRVYYKGDSYNNVTFRGHGDIEQIKY